ncbi:alpha/beta fold hydrolase [Kutzneria kofuensis]|uniref:Pimeloyl-ACP methyl ester carboxylesterase n=1 Tax=Kutzneria kofuensis TaxID=103725 RepID=A0A7W9KL83_9PSEU|nr:alpha/beta fold hydrolase [Kutzneria kofuensis]MBB5894600.1 pimeloyl-ACP methyl ester carboxylesterase [Kutzneria kofuensis]
MPRHSQSGRSLGVLVPVLMLAAGACAVGPSVRPVIAVNDGAQTSSAGAPTQAGQLPPLDKPQNSSIAWSDCTSATKLRMPETTTSLSFQCGRITTPLDAPDQPGVGDVAVAVLKAGDGAIPLVVVNDATGVPGTLYAAELASKLPAPLLKTFSLIGMDRRGTGASDPAQCIPGSARAEIADYDPDSTQLDNLIAAAKRASQECVLELDDRLQALDSWRTAGDLDQLRDALGVPRLNAIGHGEGSRVLTIYADRYGSHTGRLVLDGSPDPILDPPGAAQAGAVGAEATFDAFASSCRSRGCSLGADPKQAVLSLLDKLRQHPNGDLSVGTAVHAVLMGLADRASWAPLADAISAALRGDENPLAEFAAPLSTVVDGDPPLLDTQLITGCNDMQMRLPPEQISGMVQDWKQKAPLFGGLFAQQLLLCSSWPVPARQLPAPSGHGAPPILVLSTADDPVTPEAGTQRTARQLASGVLVSWEGGGHGALAQSPCATAAVQHFLVDAQVPTDGTACPP